ncbi:MULTISPECIES: FeoA family protein [unclassified Bacillus (in: firmicutes)]|uniref:FeoA family protein n=1 Tax=unclassified Bacillus (in: firmicutes) TaxID=185979 RepID=UPI0008E219CF|nr:MULTISPECIES: FeoA family protein [unclassified Bacillus (in: firmicutes)]SFJ32655.1 ferrous iron transport protein A [Bacillus sp. 71mf]SFT01829.1 ferrous iron transport protein A [Bacillus sp. 103mf]
MNLVDMSIDEKVRVKDLQSLDTLLKRRLASFGFSEGCELCIKQKAMLNGPCTLECRGQLISIRHCDAKMIKVELA